MTIVELVGDMFDPKYGGAYAHGVNARGIMGKGIALQFKQRYPDMDNTYFRLCNAKKLVGGDVYPYIAEDRRIIFNLVTQSGFGGANITFVRESFVHMAQIARVFVLETIVMPRIGCGLGKLQWQYVRPILEEADTWWDGTFYVYRLSDKETV